MPHTRPEPPPQPLPPPTGKPDRRALLQAYQEVVRSSRLRPPRPRLPARDRQPFWVAAGLTIACLIALLVFQPSWMFTRAPSESPQMQEASLRIRMYVEIDRVQRFKDANGHWPATLEDAGGDPTGLSFERRGDDFILSGTNGLIQLRYRSGESPDAFLGNSYQLVRERGK